MSADLSVRVPEDNAPPVTPHELARVADVLARALAAAWRRHRGAQDAGPSPSAHVSGDTQPQAELSTAA